MTVKCPECGTEMDPKKPCPECGHEINGYLLRISYRYRVRQYSCDEHHHSGCL